MDQCRFRGGCLFTERLALPEGRVIGENKAVSQQNAFSASDGHYRFKKSSDSHNELILLTNLADSASSMADLASKLDIENAANSDKYSSWLKDATKALGEILKEYEQFYEHMLEVAQVVDRQINVGEIHCSRSSKPPKNSSLKILESILLSKLA